MNHGLAHHPTHSESAMEGKRKMSAQTERLSNNVRSLREDLLLSKAELARRAGISAITVDRIENGADSRLDTKRKIILALGKSIEQKGEVFPEFNRNPGDREELAVISTRSSHKEGE